MVTKMKENNHINLLTDEAKAEIQKILNHGNTAEIKKEKDRLVIVEIKRAVKIKTSITG